MVEKTKKIPQWVNMYVYNKIAEEVYREGERWQRVGEQQPHFFDHMDEFFWKGGGDPSWPF